MDNSAHCVPQPLRHSKLDQSLDSTETQKGVMQTINPPLTHRTLGIKPESWVPASCGATGATA